MIEKQTLANRAQQKSYDSMIDYINLRIKDGYLPDLKLVRREYRSLGKRIKALEHGIALCATNLEEVRKAEAQIDVLSGTRAAYKQIIDIMNK